LTQRAAASAHICFRGGGAKLSLRVFVSWKRWGRRNHWEPHSGFDQSPPKSAPVPLCQQPHRGATKRTARQPRAAPHLCHQPPAAAVPHRQGAVLVRRRKGVAVVRPWGVASAGEGEGYKQQREETKRKRQADRSGRKRQKDKEKGRGRVDGVRQGRRGGETASEEGRKTAIRARGKRSAPPTTRSTSPRPGPR
jgi:hypothetical protein